MLEVRAELTVVARELDEALGQIQNTCIGYVDIEKGLLERELVDGRAKLWLRRVPASRAAGISGVRHRCLLSGGLRRGGIRRESRFNRPQLRHLGLVHQLLLPVLSRAERRVIIEAGGPGAPGRDW